MVESSRMLSVGRNAAPPPSPAVLYGIGVAGCVAAAISVWLAFNSDHVDQPGVQAALMVWMVLGYVLAGLVSWWRRPSRFGPLMIAAGFSIFVSSLSWANGSLLFTIGIAFDLVPAVVFLHVFLAFPTGTLRSRFERVLLGVGYVTAFGFQLVAMALDGFGPGNLLSILSEPDTAELLAKVQLVVLAAVSLAGIGVLALRRRGSGRPLRKPLALLVDSFALGLAMIAFLFLSAAFGLVEGDQAFETIRRATFFVIGLAPIAFLFGLLHARLLRSGVGDLVRRAAKPIPRRRTFGTSSRSALRDPSLDARLLAARLRLLRRPRRPARGAAELRQRASGDADRARRRTRRRAAPRRVALRRARAARRGRPPSPASHSRTPGSRPISERGSRSSPRRVRG